MRITLARAKASNLKYLIKLYLEFLTTFDIIEGKTLKISLSKRATNGKEIRFVFNSTAQRVEVQIDYYYYPIISLNTKRFPLKIKKEKCWICGENKNLHYHHIIPYKYFGTNSILNIIVLCANCHKLIHKYLNKKLKHLELLGGKEIIKAELMQDTYISKKKIKQKKKPKKYKKSLKRKINKKRQPTKKLKKKIKKGKHTTKRRKKLALDDPNLILKIIRLE